MQRPRITLEIDVDLDPLPGNFHTPEQAERAIFGLLHMRIPHYDPTVRVQELPPVAAAPDFLDQNQRINDYALKMAREMFPTETDMYAIKRHARHIADGIKRGF